MQSSMNTTQTERNKFKHDTSKILFFDTFFYREQIYYLVQCESKNVFVGNSSHGKFEVAWKGLIQDKIKNMSLMWMTSTIFVSCSSGVIFGFDFKKNIGNIEDEEGISLKIEVGKQSIGLISRLDKQNNERIVYTFHSDGEIRQYKNQALISRIKIPHEIYRFRLNKKPTNNGDCWCAFMIRKYSYPFIFDITILDDFLATPDRFQNNFEQYIAKLQYQPDQFTTTEIPLAICLSESKAVFVMMYQKKITVYIMKKQEEVIKLELDFQFVEDFPFKAIDLVGNELAYSTEQTICMYDISKRKKISKKMSIKKNQVYNIILWAKPFEFLLYGYNLEKSKIIFHNVKIKGQE